jgi:predicted negative regulator of RcsB-dependent stress response
VWRREKRVVSTVVLDSNAIDWSDTAGLAAFVTPESRAVRNLVDQALRAPASLPPSVNVPARVVEAARTLGLRYQPDANLPYKGARVDHVQFPDETLQRLRGDCDDISATIASMLEAAGVRTAIVATPRHVLVLADTGVPAHEATNEPFNSKRWIPRNGTLWIPIETTAIDRGFIVAWAEGVREYRRWSKKTQVIDLAVAWARFPAMPAKANRSAKAMGRRELSSFDASLAKVGETLSTRFAQGTAEAIKRGRKIVTKEPGNIKARLRLVQLLANEGRLGEAKGELKGIEAALKKNAARTLRARVTEVKGNVAMSEGNADEALRHYASAEALGRLSAQGYSNLALAKVLKGDNTGARRAYRESARRGGTPHKMARAQKAPKSGAATPQIDVRTLESILNDALDTTPLPGDLGERKGTAVELPTGGRRGAQDAKVAVVSLIQWAP